jgi:hypothetical protein
MVESRPVDEPQELIAKATAMAQQRVAKPDSLTFFIETPEIAFENRRDTR